LQRSAKQPDVGRQTRQPWISSRFKESRFDAEHWVGGILEVAHSGIGKTHTRLGGVSERSLTLVLAKSVDFGFSQKLRAKSQQLLHEDDIWQLNRLGKYKAL
jgi:hypothetical protein